VNRERLAPRRRSAHELDLRFRHVEQTGDSDANRLVRASVARRLAHPHDDRAFSVASDSGRFRARLDQNRH